MDSSEWHGIDFPDRDATSVPSSRFAMCPPDELLDGEQADKRTRSHRRTNKIVRIDYYGADGSYAAHGTGCLIDPQHVLTAAHLFRDEHDVARPVRRFRIMTQDGTNLGKVVRVVNAPKFSKREFVAAVAKSDISKAVSNIAVCRLESPIPDTGAAALDGVYPVITLPLEEGKVEQQSVAIDGFPLKVKGNTVNGLHRGTTADGISVKGITVRGVHQGTSDTAGPAMYGATGLLTRSGNMAQTLVTNIKVSEGCSGAPVFLVDANGEYVRKDFHPIVVGVALHIGGKTAVSAPMSRGIMSWLEGWFQSFRRMKQRTGQFWHIMWQ